MKNISFKTTDYQDFSIIHFDLDTIFSPTDLKSLKPPNPIQNNFAHKGIILSGRGPIWLYGFLVHYYHPTRWVATYDPRLQAAVVVESHDPTTAVGDLISLPQNPLS